jgi:peptide deformylase
MAIFPIRTYGDPVLRTPTTPVAIIDESVHKLVADLIETMYDAPESGLPPIRLGCPAGLRYSMHTTAKVLDR